MCIYSLGDQFEVLKNLQSPYNIELKKRIQGSLNGQYVQTALNDFFITKRNSIQLVCLDIYFNDTFVTQGREGRWFNNMYSIAYCLSAGDPLILNRVPCIALVTICPLSLSFRPLILLLAVKIGIKMNANSRGEGVVICDGQVQYDLKRNNCFDITQSKNDVLFMFVYTIQLLYLLDIKIWIGLQNCRECQTGILDFNNQEIELYITRSKIKYKINYSFII